MLKKVIVLNKTDFALFAAVIGGAFLLQEIVVNIIMSAVRPNSIAALGGIMLPCWALMLCLFANIFQLPMGFDLLLRFGVTRRNALLGVLGLMAADTVFAFALALLLAQADRLIVSLWLRARPGLGLEEIAVPLWGVATMAVAALLLGLIFGAVVQTFGRKSLWVLWGAWMGFFILMNATGWENIAQIQNIPPAAIVVIVIVLLAAIGWSVWSLLRACVKG